MNAKNGAWLKMKTLTIPKSATCRPPASTAALRLRAILPSRAIAASPSGADALALRRLLVAAWLGFGSFVAAMLTTIPEWTGFACYAWLMVCILAFAGAVALVVGALAAFAPRTSPAARRR
jgi:hypothetical protein